METETFFDVIAKRYDRYFLNAVSQIENELVTRDLPTRNVLDLGCGTGLYLEYCQPSGYVGLDLSEGMLAVARAKFPFHRFIQGDMSAIPLPDASFDAIVSLFGSFSYCLTPHQCVEEIGRVLRPNGRAVVMAYGQRYITRKSHIAPFLPFWTYTARQLRHLFSPIGQVEIRGLNMALDALSWLPTALLRGISHIEYQTLNRAVPDACYFLLVEVIPNAQAHVSTECLRSCYPTACETL